MSAHIELADQPTHEPIQNQKHTAENNINFNPPLIDQIYQAPINTSQSEININIKNGVATLSGTSNSAASSNMLEYLVSRINEVDVVINLIANENRNTNT